MDVGFLFDLRNPAQWHRPWADHYARTLEFCEEADQRGAGGIWFTEHHLFEDGYLPQPLTFAAAAAARTHNVRIGTAVLLPALRKPAQLAEEAAVVDLISGGRLELGLGAGYRVPEYDLFDVDIRDRYPATENNIREIRRLWAEGGITPGPIQDPLPIWGGFYGPRGARIAGRLGINLLHISRDIFEHYRAGLIEGGHDPAAAQVSDLLPIMLADDPDAAWSRVVPHLAHQMNTYRQSSVEGTDKPKPPLIVPEEFRHKTKDRPWGALEILTPEDACARVRKQTDGLPVKHLIFWASIAGMPDDLVTRNIELISEHLPTLLGRESTTMSSAGSEHG
ncbi:alkanesulfonate monooxygenase SsuD/methylene tetrahydromethanopterin reductase-like flavin-dependent oxidoreductase (luciferase family) [Actinopolyspora biskrensis]|uniref:Alkanesulfonate monooxygenase SsuD/methylene tetrahydromethanopterin reductase-like flavin-dependent oxidoreductase (Luciferase family) n=1 Tax=Actinopolyspora biskrensis TaxID=1470178 RepID=A0A852YS87_9ACTN|nr:LLM class flavin-dependent oxidoreductase [Actinopolyspora biskrensis]NYH77581.1 alkanesulfonate monooxygenase SsuD/methylene tetrahydromethanopterin reductase-like flavin-dependent oxidoreductase (luciferase family) [Actinopolyspora biskrensis]